MNSFWKNVSSVFTGTVIAQSIPIIGSLFITRIFNPVAFGEYSAWLAIVTVVAVIITLRFETALAIVADGKAREQAVFFTLFISMAICLLFFIVFLFVGGIGIIPGGYILERLDFLLLVAPGALSIATNQIWQSWAAAEGYYKRLTLMRIAQTGILTPLQIVIGLKFPSAFSLAISFILAGFVSFIVIENMMPRILKKQYLSITHFKFFFHRYKNFPKYALPADSINTIAAQLPIAIVAFRFGADIAGFLALTMRVLGAPIGLVGKAVLDVFKRYAAQSFITKGNCKQLYITTFLGLLLASLGLVFGTILFGEFIFSVAFGEGWKISGVMAIWLLPLFALRFIASPLSYIVYIVEKQHIDLIWQISLAILAIVSFFIFSSYKETLILYSFIYALMYTIYLWISYNFSKGL